MIDRRKHEVHRCDLCGRIVPRTLITLHHLLPKQKGGVAEHRVPMCRPCHKQIHATFSNAELARGFKSIAQLREAPQLQGFLKWIRKQRADRSFLTRMSLNHPDYGRRRKRR